MESSTNRISRDAKTSNSSSGLLHRFKRLFNREGGKKKAFKTLSPVARHQFEKMKSKVFLEASSGGPRAILFTSYNHGEGTSTVAANFAACLAQDRKFRILLVDAHTRKPGLEEFVAGSAVNHPVSFSDVASPEASGAITVGTGSESNFFLVRCGSTAYHPSENFDHTQFAGFVNRAKEVFDFIILDSSPIGKYYDAVVLATRMDGVVLVTESEKTPAHELRMAKQTLLERNIPILGVVLNRRRFHIPSFVFERFCR